MNMVERVAKALADCALEPLDELSRSKFMGDARAAIAAMREPTKAMCHAANDVGFDRAGNDETNSTYYLTGYEAEDVWRAMIDAALK